MRLEAGFASASLPGALSWGQFQQNLQRKPEPRKIYGHFVGGHLSRSAPSTPV